MDEFDLDGLDSDLQSIEGTIGSTRVVLDAFDTEVRAMGSTVAETGREVGSLSRGLSQGLKKSFEGLVFDGDKLSDALKGVARSMIDATFKTAVTPATSQASGLLSAGLQNVLGRVMPFADGGAFSQGQVMPFAKGGVVSQATRFPMRGGQGLMGEAGPEAIVPLKRGADGRLGIAGGGRAPVHVTMNISTPDAEGFRRSQSQIASQMSRALARGQRNR
ncbi:phage tail tape measure protein [Palleronia sp. LCG004]|nr:phage tail tape measure protein [Palleronia sp. LCG004]WOI55008.1 phage tail tape measure protein [Palleronia sp. LCG004]